MKKLKIKKTERGFSYYDFIDCNNNKCSLQKSSSATEDKIWLGLNNANPKMLAKMINGSICHINYPLPKEVYINTRMHLTREQVKKILPILQEFVETGDLSK